MVAGQASLFERAVQTPELGRLESEMEHTDLAGGAWIDFRPGWFGGADILFDCLHEAVPWRELLRCYRALELRGEIRGGRFVAGFDGEQYALPDAVAMLRKWRRNKRTNDEKASAAANAAAIGAPAADGDVDAEPLTPAEVTAADPLNLVGILTPDERIAPQEKRNIQVG